MFKLLKYKLQNLDGLYKLENLIKVHVETKPFKIFRHIYNICLRLNNQLAAYARDKKCHVIK